MTTCSPQQIAHHLRHTLAPMLATLDLPGDDAARHARTLRACAATLDRIDIPAVAANLADARTIALGGRPRAGESGPRAVNGISNPTADIASEVFRIVSIGASLRRALDCIHPDPDWPTVASGWRSSQSTSTEAIQQQIDAWRQHNTSADNLDDTVATCAMNVRVAYLYAMRALRCRAWPPPKHEGTASIDPPDPILEAQRCTSWPLGRDRTGEPQRCGNWRSEHRDANGSEHCDDLCDDCYRLVCPQCWIGVRRTPGAKECSACEIRERRRTTRVQRVSHGFEPYNA